VNDEAISRQAALWPDRDRVEAQAAIDRDDDPLTIFAPKELT